MYDIGGVHEVCVFGVPDEKWGEWGKAVVSVKPGKTVTKEQIITALGSKLARYKIPKYITFVDEVPKNNVEKSSSRRWWNSTARPRTRWE
jgi:fatty-acyl-CoA synthase